jgi:hypothetical protein
MPVGILKEEGMPPGCSNCTQDASSWRMTCLAAFTGFSSAPKVISSQFSWLIGGADGIRQRRQ